MKLRQRTGGDPGVLPDTLHPVLRRVYANRGIRSAAELDTSVKQMLPPTIGGLDQASELLHGAIERGERIVIAGDYDADGATSTALAVSTLRDWGGDVEFCVPDRFRMGYGLSPALVHEQVQMLNGRTLVTVDCGIASHAGVRAARELGMTVIITDHHLPGEDLPDANAIVNPNCQGDAFPSKHLAGVGVMFYLLTALRTRLRAAGRFAQGTEPSLSGALDLVALGTVADLVRLDHNNRVLVEQGLRRIRAGRARPGIQALLEVAGRERSTVSAADLGFAVGPRLNAAGRLTDMGLGIRCLLAAEAGEARRLAGELDRLNRERRELQGQMEAQAMEVPVPGDAVGICLFDPGWHEGVVGLLASRVKDRHHRPAVVFARAQQEGMLKGSARSISGLHIRDALVAVDAGEPGLIERFGGHAMAAGLSIREQKFESFRAAFDEVCRKGLPDAALEQVIETDGSLAAAELTLETALALEEGGPWGQGFPEPLFEGEFEVESARVVGEDHVKYRLRLRDGTIVPAIHFRGLAQMVEQRGRFIYRPVVSRWQGEQLELQVQHRL